MATEQKSGTQAGVTPEEAWAKIPTPEKQGQIVKNVVGLAMLMGLSPEDEGEFFSTLDDDTANKIAYLYSVVGDGATVKAVGEKLKPTR